MSAPRRCLCCLADSVGQLVDFGAQPPSNRFEQPDAPSGESHRLAVGQCERCGLLQLIEPMAPATAKSRYEWLTYNEPEGHLDDLVERLRHLPDIGTGSRIVGLTYKDDSTLARFNRLGYANTYRLDATADLAMQDPCAGLESIQSAVDPTTASRLVHRYGPADLLLVRHVLEHAHAPAAFLTAVGTLVKPGGYLLFEMPDCTKFIKACDYSFIWEEHITYFCKQTLEMFLGKAGLEMQEMVVYPYPLEDSLIGIVKNDAPTGREEPGHGVPTALIEDGKAFSRQYPEIQARLQSLMKAWRQAGKRIAIFGAGHLAAKFVNLYALGSMIDCVIDDNPNKQRLLMPRSRLAIHGSAELESRGIDVCLLSLNPESEQKVLSKHQPFLERGGQFFSIFAMSSNAVYNMSTS
jgi:hypothetical protein